MIKIEQPGPPNEHERHFVNAVFETDAPGDAQPRPAAEMPAILALGEAQIRQAAGGMFSLGDLIAGSGRLWSPETLPRSTRLLPGGSAQWYLALLDYLSSLDGKEHT